MIFFKLWWLIVGVVVCPWLVYLIGLTVVSGGTTVTSVTPDADALPWFEHSFVLEISPALTDAAMVIAVISVGALLIFEGAPLGAALWRRRRLAQALAAGVHHFFVRRPG